MVAPNLIVQKESARRILDFSEDQLSDLLKRAREELSIVEPILRVRSERQNSLNEYLRWVKAPSLTWTLISTSSIIFIITILIRILSRYYQEWTQGNSQIVTGRAQLTSPVMIAFSIVAPIGVAVLLSLYRYRRAVAKRTSTIKSLEEDIEKIDHQLAITIQQTSNAIWAIPDIYRYSLAVNTMLGYLYAQRAQTWPVLADKYEEQLHRWILEKNSEEAVLLQKQILYATQSAAGSAHAAAAFSGIAAAATGVSAAANITRLFL